MIWFVSPFGFSDFKKGVLPLARLLSCEFWRALLEKGPGSFFHVLRSRSSEPNKSGFQQFALASLASHRRDSRPLKHT